jgi:hypothetical protein
VEIKQMNIDLISAWLLSFLDFAMIYIFVNNLIGNNSKITFKQLSSKEGFLAIGFGLLMGTLSSVFNNLIYQGVFAILVLFIIYLVVKYKRKKYEFSDLILIFLIYYSIIHVVIGINLFVMDLLYESQRIIHLMTYMSSTISSFIICWKVEFNKLLVFLSHKVLIRLFLFILVFIFVSLSAFLNFEYSDAIQYTILVLFIVGLLGVFYALKHAYHYTDVLPTIDHDTRNLILLQSIKMEETDDVKELRNISEKIIALIGMDASIPKDPDTLNKSESFLLKSIDVLKRNKNHHTNIITKIKYFETHKTIDDVEIAYMLSVLLENAMETMTTKPIFVEVLCSENRILIKVENEMKDELDQMLLKSYSTKGTLSRGFGLAKLDKFVKSHHGCIKIM